MPHRSTSCCDLLLLATVSFCWLLLLLLLPLAAHVSAFFDTLTMWAFYKVPPLRFCSKNLNKWSMFVTCHHVKKLCKQVNDKSPLHRLTAEET